MIGDFGQIEGKLWVEEEALGLCVGALRRAGGLISRNDLTFDEAYPRQKRRSLGLGGGKLCSSGSGGGL